jgi:hypothetical protein
VLDAFDRSCNLATLAQCHEQRSFDACGRFPLAHRRAYLA